MSSNELLLYVHTFSQVAPGPSLTAHPVEDLLVLINSTLSRPLMSNCSPSGYMGNHHSFVNCQPDYLAAGTAIGMSSTSHTEVDIIHARVVTDKLDYFSSISLITNYNYCFRFIDTDTIINLFYQNYCQYLNA